MAAIFGTDDVQTKPHSYQMDFRFLKAFVRSSIIANSQYPNIKVAKQEVSSYFSNTVMYGHQT